MIPYPSSSPSGAPNVTYIESPADRTATIVGGTAIGALGIGGAFAIVQYLQQKRSRTERRRREEKEEAEEAEEEETDEANGAENKQMEAVGIRLEEGLSYVCVATGDLEDVVRLLTVFHKRFHVLESAPSTNP